MTNELDDLMTIPDAAKLIPHETETSLRNKARDSKINAVKLGREWFLTPAEVERIKAENDS